MVIKDSKLVGVVLYIATILFLLKSLNYLLNQPTNWLMAVVCVVISLACSIGASRHFGVLNASLFPTQAKDKTQR